MVRLFQPANPSGIADRSKVRCNATMSTKSRQTIYGGAIMGADIRAKSAREAAKKAAQEADRAEAEAWSVRDGRLRRNRPALANGRAMPKRGPRLVRGRVQPL